MMNMIVLGVVLLPLVCGKMLAGGPLVIKTDRDDVQKMARFALTQLNTVYGTTETGIKVLSAQVQVVSGTSYTLTVMYNHDMICNVTVWDRPWIPSTIMTEHTCWHTKHDAGDVGSATPVDVHSQDVQTMATFALAEMNKLTGVRNNLVNVISAKSQVVAGTNYFLKIAVQYGTQRQVCDITVWDQPWTGLRKMTDHHCTSQQLAGGFSPVDVHGVEIQNMANFALSEINGLQKSQNTLVEVVSAKTQIVSGVKYDLTIRIQSGSQVQLCEVKVWSQFWLNKTQLTYQKCQGDVPSDSPSRHTPTGFVTLDTDSSEAQKMAKIVLSKINEIESRTNSLVQILTVMKQHAVFDQYIVTLRVEHQNQVQICTGLVQESGNNDQLFGHHCKSDSNTRQLLGAPTDVDVNDRFVQGLAQYGVTVINQLDSTQKTLMEVVSAKTQLVSGTNYILTVRVKNNNKTQLCDMTIWRQPWLNTLGHVIKHSCYDNTARASLPGGVKTIRMSEQVHKAVNFAEDALNLKSNNLYRLVSEKVDNIKEQVVAGMKYTFDIHLVTSSCLNSQPNMGKGLELCATSKNAQHMTCSVTVLFQAWMKPQYTLLGDHCSPLA